MAQSRNDWHSVNITIPFETTDQAQLVKKVIQVDKPLRPSEITRTLTVNGVNLTIEFKSSTVRQARVALDHCLSDLQLIVQTLHQFRPDKDAITDAGAAEAHIGGDPSMEVGMMGSWGGKDSKAESALGVEA